MTCDQTSVMKNAGTSATWDETLRLQLPGKLAERGPVVSVRVKDGDNITGDKVIGSAVVAAPKWTDDGEVAVGAGFGEDRWYAVADAKGVTTGEVELALYWEKAVEIPAAAASADVDEVGDGVLLVNVIGGTRLGDSKRVRMPCRAESSCVRLMHRSYALHALFMC